MNVTTLNLNDTAPWFPATLESGGATARTSQSGPAAAACHRPDVTGSPGQPAATVAPYSLMPTVLRHAVEAAVIKAPERGYAVSGALLKAVGEPLRTVAFGVVANTTVDAPPPAQATPLDDTMPSIGDAPTLAAATSKTATTSRELAFLDDKKLSIEEKLYRYMALMLQKSDQELVDEMKAFEGKKTTSSSSKSSSTKSASSPGADATDPSTASGTADTSASGGDATGSAPDASGGSGVAGYGGADIGAGATSGSTSPSSYAAIYKRYQEALATGTSFDPLDYIFTGPGLLDVVGQVVDGIGSVIGDVGQTLVGGVETLAKDLGGPLLAATATALDMPFLAPLALKIGGDVGAAVVDGAASLVGLDVTSGSKDAASAAATTAPDGSAAGAANPTIAAAAKTATSSASSSAAGEPDEKLEMLNLQRLVEKQNAMFAALSNVLKSLHDTQMTVVQNIR